HPSAFTPRTRLCGPVRHVAVPGYYPASRSAEPGLSSMHGSCTAAARPTPACNFTPRGGGYKASLGSRSWTMKRRLYFLLPDVESATRTANDLLLARVEDRHMHFLARRGTDLGELHEASYLIKTDLMRGAGIGLFFGVLGGVVLGYLIVNHPLEGTHPGLAAAVIAAIVGALLGVWMGSMAATAVPNSRLKQFGQDIDRGMVLMIVDVPYVKVDRSEERRVGKEHGGVSSVAVDVHGV